MATTQNSSVLNAVLDQLPMPYRNVIENTRKYKPQILYTAIDRDRRNRPSFVNHAFNVDPKKYFYPASLVKLPVAVLALEKIAALNIPGLTRTTSMAVESTRDCPVDYGPENGTSIETLIKRMLLVSDNAGYNRLWEFLTRDYTHSQLALRGYDGIRLLHRLAPCTIEQNALHNPVRFIAENGEVLYSQPQSHSLVTPVNPCAPVTFGLAAMQSGALVPTPFKGDHLNYAALEDLHRFLTSVMFPETIDKEKQFSLSPCEYRLLRTWMSALPRESGIYATYPDHFKKYLLYGANPLPVSPLLREFNIVGKAYGFIGDTAYFADFTTGVEFFLSAVMYANENEIINDDRYEYDTVALPFFAALTRAIYQYELSRPRLRRPDLSGFRPDMPCT
jgi:hypothetical protein